jgi:FMN-dependent NADH-azoreductase
MKTVLDISASPRGQYSYSLADEARKMAKDF